MRNFLIEEIGGQFERRHRGKSITNERDINEYEFLLLGSHFVTYKNQRENEMNRKVGTK